MNSLLFACPGIPLSTNPSNTVNGIARVRELGLDAMEMEWVRNIHVSREKAPEVKAAAKKNNVLLTCHGQYWVNLNSKEEEKVVASVKRMVDAAKRADDIGVYSITWHFAFNMGQSKDAVYAKVKDGVRRALSQLDGTRVWIRPETTGKPTQWGDVDEVIRLSEDFDRVLPCIDFSHIFARSIGKINSYSQFSEILEKVEKKLGREALNNMHIHTSGIEYGPKGERHHLNLEESRLAWNDLVKVWKDFRIKGVVVAESPNIEEDAILLQKAYKELL